MTYSINRAIITDYACIKKKTDNLSNIYIFVGVTLTNNLSCIIDYTSYRSLPESLQNRPTYSY